MCAVNQKVCIQAQTIVIEVEKMQMIGYCLAQCIMTKVC